MTRELRSGRDRCKRAARALTRVGWRRACAFACITGLACAGVAHADGGVTADSRQSGTARATAFVAPMLPRVGPVDVSVLLTPQPTSEQSVEVIVRAVHVESGIERSTQAQPAHQGNRLLRSALLDLPRAGRWSIDVRIEVTIAPEGPWPSLAFEIEVAPPMPPWRTQWPWLFAWVPLAALLLWRDRLAADRGRSASTIGA